MSLYSSYNSTTGQTPQVLYFNVAVNGNTCQNRIDAAPAKVDIWFQPRRKFNVVSLNCGINDYKQGTSDPNTTYARILAYVAARQAVGWGNIIVLTVQDDAATNLGDQTAWQTYRHALNALISGGAVAHGYTVMDIAADASMGCDGCALTHCGTNQAVALFRDDSDSDSCEHPTVAGYTIFATLENAILTAMGFN